MFDFLRIATSNIGSIKVGNCKYNTDKIIDVIEKSNEKGVKVLTLPELCITGYTCGDLFFQSILLKECEKQVERILDYSKNIEMIINVGIPVSTDNQLFNCIGVICKGKLLGLVAKTYLPNYNEFYEERWFSSAVDLISKEIVYANNKTPIGNDIIFNSTNSLLKLGVEVCEDLWATIPPSSYLCQGGANLIINSSASNELVAKPEYRRNLIEQQSSRCICAYAYASASIGESTQDTIFSGHCMIYENGNKLNEIIPFEKNENLIVSDIDLELLVNERKKQTTYMSPSKNIKDLFRVVEFNIDMSTDFEKVLKNKNLSEFEFYRNVFSKPFTPVEDYRLSDRCEHILSIQSIGLARRFQHTNSKKLVIGISGGLDSTLALLVAVRSCDYLNISRKSVLGITMPGFGTTGRTYNNSIDLMKSLGITIKEISIVDSVLQHFKDIEHDVNVYDVTYENGQARERTQILMDIANQQGGIVVGTGDLSELALGWATYNGDHMSMYGVNGGVPKTLVRVLVKHIALSGIDEKSSNILLDVLDTPVSPELIPPDENGNINQKTEDLVGPYELHDFFLYNVIRFGFPPKKVLFLAIVAFENKYDYDTLLKWLKNFYRRFFQQQFKRSCLPDGPKIGAICLSPRADWRMPTDASSTLWLDELEDL